MLTNRELEEMVYELYGAVKDTGEALELENEGTGAKALSEHAKRCAQLDIALKERARKHAAVKSALDNLKDAEQFEPVLRACDELVDAPRAAQGVAAHRYVDTFERTVWKVHHASEAFPSAAAGSSDAARGKKKRKSAGGGDNDDDDDDDDELEIGLQEKSIICPLTTLTLEDPVMNVACKHTFSRLALLDYIKKHETVNRRIVPVACPQQGCNQKLDKATLVRDEEAEFAIKEAQRRAKPTRRAAVDL